MNRQRKGRLMLVFLLCLFVFPVLIALYLHVNPQGMRGKSHGELVQPPRKLALAETQVWRDKWHLVFVTSGQCTQACRDTLHMMRQIHAAQAKNIGRLQRVWISETPQAAEELVRVQQRYPDLLVLNAAGDKARQFDLPGAPAGVGGGVYLVDPLGNLMMIYPRGTDPNGIRKDLARLLTYSWTG